MAVLQLVPHSGIVVDAEVVTQQRQPEAEIASTSLPNPVITSPRVDPAILAPFLRIAAELALRSSGATGCAIAMRAGAGFRCYASVGDAPPTNTPVRLAGTLTGLCVRKGKTVRRDDVANESPELTGYAAPASSALLAPIFQDGNVTGVIGIFAPEPHTLFEEHATALENIAGVIGIALMHPERLASCEVPAVQEVAAAERAAIAKMEAETQAARALETIARVVSNTLLHSQRPVLPPDGIPRGEGETRAGSAPRKKLVGLPCSGCGAYFPSDEPSCPVCGARR